MALAILFADAAIRTAAESALTEIPDTPPCAILTTNGSMSVIRPWPPTPERPSGQRNTDPFGEHGDDDKDHSEGERRGYLQRIDHRDFQVPV